MFAEVPVPDSATVSGLPGALLFTDRVPLAEPAAVGANVTLTVQEAPAASEVPQLLVSLNGPVTPTEAIETAAAPGFDTVTVWCWWSTHRGAAERQAGRRRRQRRLPGRSSRRRGRPRTPTAGPRSSRCCR